MDVPRLAATFGNGEVLRDLHEYVLPLHEHAERRGLLPLSSFDVRQQQTTLGTLFATILRDECRVDLCLYNSRRARQQGVRRAADVRGLRRRGAV